MQEKCNKYAKIFKKNVKDMQQKAKNMQKYQEICDIWIYAKKYTIFRNVWKYEKYMQIDAISENIQKYAKKMRDMEIQ